MKTTRKKAGSKPKWVIQGISFSAEDAPLLDYAKARAVEDGRPLANWIRRLIEQHREQHTTNNGNPQAG